MTRSVWVHREDERAQAHDDATVVGRCASSGSTQHGASPAGSFEEIFRQYYPAFRKLLNDHREPGLALVVASGEGLEASAWLAAKEDDVNAWIIGRHSSAEVFLPSEPALSLRHLAVILYRREDERPARFRVLDLRTAIAFADEQGNRLEAVEAQGPLLIRCASFAIFLVPTVRSEDPWPEDPDVAWMRIPERVYLERESADPARWLVPAGGARQVVPQVLQAGHSGTTLVDSFPGPVFGAWVLEGSGPARGELVVHSASGRVSLPVSVSAARQGVLLGRYERCDTAGLPVLSSDKLSRVHLLVIEIEGVLYALDTASTNGSWLPAGPLRATRVEPGRKIMLARDASVEWRPFH
jgi:hypothetical protein